MSNGGSAMTSSPSSTKRSIGNDAIAAATSGKKASVARGLYGFFSSAYSAVDSSAYWLYSIGAAKWPTSFPYLQAPAKEWLVALKATTASYETVPAGSPVLTKLQAVASSPEYQRVRDIRNVLNHRVHPGRSIHLAMSGSAATKPKPAEMDIAGQTLILEAASLQPYRDWLASALSDLLVAGTAVA
jgi:hypothetical protein